MRWRSRRPGRSAMRSSSAAHIRIDAVYQLSRPRSRALIDVFRSAALAAFAALLVWFSFRLLEFAWANDAARQHAAADAHVDSAALWYSGLVLFFLIVALVTVARRAAWARATFALVAASPAWRATRRKSRRPSSSPPPSEAPQKKASRPCSSPTFAGMLVLLFPGIPVAPALFGLALLPRRALHLDAALSRDRNPRLGDEQRHPARHGAAVHPARRNHAPVRDRHSACMARWANWLSWLPGGLMHANIGASMAFAATAGSSVATSATVSTVAVPMIDKFRYDERLFLGTLAAGGTLGILIPPSINLIIFGYLTDTSVPKLYLAGFIPGFVLGLLFMATVLLLCLASRTWGGAPISARPGASGSGRCRICSRRC